MKEKREQSKAPSTSQQFEGRKKKEAKPKRRKNRRARPDSNQ
jgi:hypothetical protein